MEQRGRGSLFSFSIITVVVILSSNVNQINFLNLLTDSVDG